MIKAVIFDIDNTLYGFDRANAAGIAAVAEGYGKDAAALKASAAECVSAARSRSKGDRASRRTHGRYVAAW